MEKKNKHFWINKILASLLSWLMVSMAHAGGPLWTITPAPGSNPTQTVPENRTATIQYIIQNQSQKPKKLVIQTMPGIVQTTSCQLAPKGQVNSSCTLNLSITGSALPKDGIHGGPRVCLANADGSPNPNQCYQPSSANSLNISRGPAVGVMITASPSSLNFVAGNNGLVTITNSATSPEPANNIAASIPGGSNISVQSTTCGASLAIGASCTITFTSPAVEGPTNITIHGSNTNTANVAITVTAVPMATINVNPTTLSFTANSTGEVTVTNDPGSPFAADNVAATIPGGSNISVQSTTCGASLAVGASCTITFTSPAVEGPTNITIHGSNTNTVNVAITVTAVPMATINVNPTTLSFTANSTGEVTVTNDPGSPVAADNVTATIPGGSNISVQSTTCGASLAVGASCTITFTSPTVEGPTTIPIEGNNTNTVNVDVTVTSQPLISITGPVQQSRIVTVSGAQLNLEVSNDAGSTANANGVTVSNQAACPGLLVDDNDCTAVAPGDSCTLVLTSNDPYAPCTITVSGSNTGNSPQALIAFRAGGGLVYAVDGLEVKVIAEADEGILPWDSSNACSNNPNDCTDVAATDLNNGATNTANIVAAISGQPGVTATNYAAGACNESMREGETDWYLPALNELGTVSSGLCANAVIPCNFGSFSSADYWSSSQDFFDPSTGFSIEFPSGFTGGFDKNTLLSVRCSRTFIF
ncbi:MULTISPECIES: DUF1566 domain-containing protein [unclassified Legionella]|uniref:DUF1566 domain-containing protein n=1 Tax=unclassified Legionella TaxID=2622702 RepID=UPI001F5E3683|nr:MULTISPECIES: DUF1566 domain-containing protein [unclassified Legionella]MDI9819398.1 DUF1566 domain-containing protein [Legionella sp. PL877]